MLRVQRFRLISLGSLALLQPSGDEELTLGKRRQKLAVLAVLALARRPVARDTLVEMFWGDQDERLARHSLSDALSHIRRVLGAASISARQTDVALSDEAPLTSDALEFMEAIEAKDLGRAIALYEGPFLGAAYVGSASFERWADRERARYDTAFLQACERHCMALARSRKWEECGAVALRWVSAQPPSANAALYLLNALKAPGTRESDLAALAQYDRLAAQLAREYEMQPDPAVTALADGIRSRLKESAGIAVVPTSEPTVAPPSETSTDPGPRQAGIAAPGVSDSAPAPAAVPGAASMAGVATAPAAVPPTARSHTARSRTARSRITRIVAGVLAAALVIITLTKTGVDPLGLASMFRGVGVLRTRSLIDAGTLRPQEYILVADFENHTPDSVLGVVAAEAMRVDLAQSRLIRVVAPATVRDVLARMKRSPGQRLDATVAREVAVREGVKAVVVGDVTAAGSRYVLTAQVLSAQSGELLAASRETANDPTVFVQTLDRLSERLRAQIGESLTDIHATPPLERVTTGSLEALRRYSQAAHAYDVEGDEAKAIALYEEAIALDTTFALAYRGLARILINRVTQRARAIDALTKAFRYRDQLTERERYLVEGAYYERVMAEPEKAAASYRTVLELHPDEQAAWTDLGNAYLSARDYARAEKAYRQAIEVDSSGSFLPYSNLWRIQMIFGRLDAADSTLARARQKFPGNRNLDAFTAALVAARGDYKAAEALTRTEIEALRTNDPTWYASAIVDGASLSVLRGRIAEAERRLRDAAANQTQHGSASSALELAALIGYLDLWYRHAPERALRTVDSALAKHPFAAMSPLDRPYLLLASFYAQAHRPARARALIAEYETIDPVLRRLDEPVYHAALGAIAEAEGRAQDAVVEWRQADRGACPSCALADLARAYEAAGAVDSALAALQRYAQLDITTLPATRGFVHCAYRAPIEKHLGELLEQRGERAGAARYDEHFLLLWSDADAELRPEVESVKRRLAKLREGA